MGLKGSSAHQEDVGMPQRRGLWKDKSQINHFGKGQREGRGRAEEHSLVFLEREDGDTVQLDQLMSFTRQRKIHMPRATGTHTLLQQVIV